MVKTKVTRSASIDIDLAQKADQVADDLDRNFSYVVNEALKEKFE